VVQAKPASNIKGICLLCTRQVKAVKTPDQGFSRCLQSEPICEKQIVLS
jgi:hypothetical protein